MVTYKSECISTSVQILVGNLHHVHLTSKNNSISLFAHHYDDDDDDNVAFTGFYGLALDFSCSEYF